MLRNIQQEHHQLQTLLEQIRKEKKNLPKGKLRVARNHGTHQYYVDGKYVSKKKKAYLEEVALRDYYEKLELILESMIIAWDNLLPLYEQHALEKTYEVMVEGRKLLLDQSLYKTVEQKRNDFEQMKCPENELPYEIQSDIFSFNGEQVRSKSEKIIADELYRRGIPYKYEMPLNLMARDRLVTVHPDFTVMNKRTGHIFLVEHLGIMDSPEYAQKAMNKISLFEKNGYLLGRDLLVFHETREEPLNSRILQKYIEEYFL